jgi:hypothetical protein
MLFALRIIANALIERWRKVCDLRVPGGWLSGTDGLRCLGALGFERGWRRVDGFFIFGVGRIEQGIGSRE